MVKPGTEIRYANQQLYFQDDRIELKQAGAHLQPAAHAAGVART